MSTCITVRAPHDHLALAARLNLRLTRSAPAALREPGGADAPHVTPWTGGPPVRRTGGHKNRRTGEQEDTRTGGHENRRTGEQEDRRTQEYEVMRTCSVLLQ